MKTYDVLPKKKYQTIKVGEIKVIGNYAYAVRRAAYTGQRDYVYRIELSYYNQLRIDARSWELSKPIPTEINIQSEIWIYLTNEAGLTPYIQTAKKI